MLREISKELNRLETQFALLGGDVSPEGHPSDLLVADAPEVFHSLPTLLWVVKHFFAGFVFAGAIGVITCWGFAYHADLADLCQSKGPSSELKKKSAAVAVHPIKKSESRKKHKKEHQNQNHRWMLKSKADLRRQELRVRAAAKKLQHLLAEAGPWSVARTRDGVLSLQCRGKIMPPDRAFDLCSMTLDEAHEEEDRQATVDHL